MSRRVHAHKICSKDILQNPPACNLTYVQGYVQMLLPTKEYNKGGAYCCSPTKIPESLNRETFSVTFYSLIS